MKRQAKRGEVKLGAERPNFKLGIPNKQLKANRKEQMQRSDFDYKEHHRLYRGPKVTAKFPITPDGEKKR